MSRKETIDREIRWILKEKYRGVRTAEAEHDILRARKGEPVDYVIGWTDFLGCRIDLSKKPLIPRPETEYWVGEAIKEIKAERTAKNMRCLDIFAGSGCIGIAVLKHVPRAVVDFAEKEQAFCGQIAINLKQNRISRGRYSVIQSDVFSRVEKQYDVIFANPPYVAKKYTGDVQQSVLKWEPKHALFAGQDGLSYIEKLLAGAKRHLVPGSVLCMEFDPRQRTAIQNIAGTYGYSSVECFKDQYNRWRFARISI